MTSKQVIDEIRRLVAKAKCSEREIYEALLTEAEGWKMRLEELDVEDEEGDE